MAKATAEATVRLSLVDRITGPIRRIQARLAGLSKGLGLDRIGRAATDVGRRIAGLGEGLARTTGRLASFTALLGLGAGGAVTAAMGLAKSASEVGSEIGELAFKLGVGVEALQEYRFAAKMSGVENETLQKGIEKLGVNAAKAAKGDKALAKGFKDLGVSVKDAHGKMRPMQNILDDTLEKLADIEDPLKRNEVAFRLFGKSGVDLVKMLGDGSDGLRELREEARRTGGVMSERAVKAADEFGDNLDALIARLEGLKLFLGVQLLPVMNEVIENITGWVDANQELIRSTISDWVQSFAGFLRELLDPASNIRQEITRIIERFDGWMEAMKPVVDFLGGPFNIALIVAAAWIAGPLVTSVALLTASFIKLGAVILSTPIGWIVTAPGVSLYVLYQRWDEFVLYWDGVWARVKAAFDVGFVQGIAAVLDEFNPLFLIAKAMDEIQYYFTGYSLLDAGRGVMKTFGDGIKSARDDAMSWVAGIMDSFERWGLDLGDTLYAHGAAAIDRFSNGLSSKVSGVTGWIDDRMAEFQSFGLRLGDALYAIGASVIQAFWDGLKSKWSEVTAWLKGAVQDLLSWLPESLAVRLGWEKPGTSETDSPAEGSGLPVVTPPSLVPEPVDLGLDTNAAGQSISESILSTIRDGWKAISPFGGEEPPSPEPVRPAETERAVPPEMRPQTIETGEVKAAVMELPTPLIAHEPQQISAPMNVGGITVNVQGMTPAEAQSMVTNALNDASKKHSTNLQSSLSD